MPLPPRPEPIQKPRRARPPRPKPAARKAPRPISDADYLRRYERELRRYVERFGPTPASGAGEAYLGTGRWVWIESGGAAVARWCRYARLHRGLQAMNPDGSWRPWDPLSIR